MRKMLFQAYDNVSMSMVGNIFADRVEAPAIRSFTDAFKTPDSLFAAHPADFDLICIGEYDDSDGRILIGDGQYPKVIVTGKSILEASNGESVA